VAQVRRFVLLPQRNKCRRGEGPGFSRELGIAGACVALGTFDSLQASCARHVSRLTMDIPAFRSDVSLREVRVGDLPILFEHQRDPEAALMAAFPSRDRDAFMAHWARILANPACATRVILCGDTVAGNIGAWTDGGERLVGYWIGREFWGRGVASAALSQFLRSETARPLTARVVKHNAGSIRVLAKNGFKLAGEDAFDAGDGTRCEEFVFKL
jgi:RimJ/RimL family protein N-acetyltransferase